MAITNCSRCGSEKVMPNLQIKDRLRPGMKLVVEVEEEEEKLNTMIFKRSPNSPMTATVCSDCGNVELTVDNPKLLWEHYSIKKNT